MFGSIRSGRRRLGPAVLFFASMVPFGIAAHLASEFAGLGWHDDAEVMFSARHAYLALIAAATLVVLLVSILSIAPSKRRARIALLIDALPYRGRGARFTLLSFAAQFIFFAITQFGEGCPLCGGDVLIGIVAAIIAAGVGAIAISFGQRRLLELVFAIVAAYRVLCDALPVIVHAARRRRPFAITARSAAFSFRYRPPPHTAAA